MQGRAQGWLTPLFHSRFREVLVHASTRYSFVVPAYCLMPDHLYLVWMGLSRASDQHNGMKFLREQLAPALRPHQFQHQAHDHVLRPAELENEAFQRVCSYILDNARVAGLVQRLEEWPYAGAIVPGYPALHPLASDFWPLFWKLYSPALAPDAGNGQRPAI